MPGPTEWIVIAVVVLLLFGYRRLPDASRAVGRSLRIFTGELKGLGDGHVGTKASAQTARGPLGDPSRSTVDTAGGTTDRISDDDAR